MKQFSSFLGLAEHLVRLGTMEARTENALEHACAKIEKLAKEKIGEYQDKAGPFAAWAPLTESTKADRSQQGFSEDDPLLRTGELRDSIEHQVHGLEGQVGSNLDIAVYQELGTKTIPPRSFLGGAAFELEPEIREELGLDLAMWLGASNKRIEVT
jgi:hypothetical protein